MCGKGKLCALLPTGGTEEGMLGKAAGDFISLALTTPVLTCARQQPRSQTRCLGKLCRTSRGPRAEPTALWEAQERGYLSSGSAETVKETGKWTFLLIATHRDLDLSE